MNAILGTNTAWIIEQMKPKPTPQSKFFVNSPNNKNKKKS
jgi:hypothetical protein